MTTSLHLCGADDLDRLLPLVEAFHAEHGSGRGGEQLAPGLSALLAGAPQGAIYLLGPRRAPVGYAALGFGWDLAQGGLTATLSEIYVRPAVRGRGIATEAQASLVGTMRKAGVAAFQVALNPTSGSAHNLFKRMGFADAPRASVLTAAL